MKKTVITTIFVAMGLCHVSAQSAVVMGMKAGSITFAVDNVQPKMQIQYNASNGADINSVILKRAKLQDTGAEIVATSFAKDSFCLTSDDVFFDAMISAFSDHRPVVISPEMIWLLISQGFSHYVNENSEAMRDKLVSHKGRMTLIHESSQDLMSKDADWQSIVDGLAKQVKQNTKGDIADVITADFTTTRAEERIASQVTLLDATEKFFDYRVIYIACGIPNITVKGTVEDWQKVYDKTQWLSSYGMREWVDELNPILKEFIKTAGGKPDISFWKDMVMQSRPDEIHGRGCGGDSKPTKIDGWFLKLFPFDKGCRTYKYILFGHDMPSEMIHVPFKYSKVNPETEQDETTDMELWAGFVGVEEDAETHALTPKIGWLVMKNNNEQSVLERLKKQNSYSSIDIQVKEVPRILEKVGHIRSLSLTFTDDVVLPEWMDRMSIDRLVIIGKVSKDERSAILRRFPQAIISK